MTRKLPLNFILFVSVVVGVLHYVGTYLYLYWRVSGFDRIVHIAGGFLVAFICLSIIYIPRLETVRKSHTILLGLFASLVIGVAWEVFELQTGITALTDKNYWFDNGGDIVSDIVGGALASWYFIRRFLSIKSS